jgi:hypothetical protein
MQTKDYIEIVATVLMLIGVGGVVLFRLRDKDKGLGVRIIQFVAVVTVLPSILILALEKALTPETTATLFGTITGYLLSGIGDYKPPPKEPIEEKKKDADQPKSAN